MIYYNDNKESLTLFTEESIDNNNVYKNNMKPNIIINDKMIKHNSHYLSRQSAKLSLKSKNHIQ